MDNKSHFIFTSNKKIRENLVRLGFSEIPSGSSFFIFLNLYELFQQKIE